MFAVDILKVFQTLDNKEKSVIFSCDSIAMRSVKVSTMLFSDEEPILAHKIALMEKSISQLLESQKNLFALVGEKLEPAKTSAQSSVQTSAAGPTPVIISSERSTSSSQANSYASTAARALIGS